MRKGERYLGGRWGNGEGRRKCAGGGRESREED